MKERLEFVNGTLDIKSEGGTTIIMKVPNVVKQPLEEAKL
jgi:two-component system sensor histidine kinase DesK